MLLLFPSPVFFPFIRLLWEEYVQFNASFSYVRNPESLYWKGPPEIVYTRVTCSGLIRTIQVLNILWIETSQSPWATCASVWPRSHENNCLLVFGWNFLFFNVHPLPLVLWAGAAEWVSLLYAPYQIFIHMDEIFPKPSLLKAEHSQLS